jgi:tripartite-type tricarboxylate transporter receptor subunit TctC
LRDPLKRFVVVAALFAALPAAAQPYPSQPIRLIAPFPPGGSVDITARLIADPLGAQLRTRIVIENRTGASGNIGMEAAARAVPDGYTIVLNTLPLVTNQSLFDKLTWDPFKDFAPIGMVATAPHVLVVPNRLAATSVADLVKAAKARPSRMTYASAGVGTTFHICAEMFKDTTQTFIQHVPYRGGGPALLDTLSGQVDMSFPTMAAALPHIKANTLRALAVTSPERSSLLPAVPSMREAGVKDFEFSQWLALLAPAGTPTEIVNRLNGALRAALATPDIKEKFEAQAMEAFPSSPDAAGRYLAGEAQRLQRVIKTRGITAD